MCTELYNGTPGNILKERIIKIVSKLLLEYGDHSKELTDQMDNMMREISRFGIDTKLAPDFLTTMLNVINIIHQKRDKETDDFMEVIVEDKEEKKKPSVVNNQGKTLGPRKYNNKVEEIIPKKKSVLNYHSSDSDDTMRSKIPMQLDIDHNNIMKLKQRILV